MYMTEKTKISTESYKGVRDFYPEDMFIQNYIFGIWRDVVQSFGYVEYGASILEPAELYKAKSGEEIVNDQTYTFIDRGDREVTLRPEMTPTVARMVAAKQQELAFPLRWFSIPNLFRYEKPQRGRLREHWQLNVDLFGVDGIEADIEVITVASQIMKKFGATSKDFVIKINSRKLLNDLYNHFSISSDDSYKISKIIDKKDKITPEIFEASLSEIIGEKSIEMIRLLSSNERFLEIIGENNKNADELITLIGKLEQANIKNVIFDPTLMRGFDYYTGIVFEVFDISPENNRSVFGGGRYDDLLDIFLRKKVPAFGFGAGDVTARDFLETRGLLPVYTSSSQLYIATLGEEYIENAKAVAQSLRAEGLNVIVDISSKKVGDQIKTANKQNVPYVVAIGENEVQSDMYTLKEMKSGIENKVSLADIVSIIKKSE